MVTAVDDHTENMTEPQANVVEIESSLEHCEPESVNHCNSIGKNGTTENTLDEVVHKYYIWKGIPDDGEDLTMNALDKEEPQVQRNCFNEKSHGGAILSRTDTIRDKGWDVIETAPNQESAVPQLQKKITVRKDAISIGTLERFSWH